MMRTVKFNSPLRLLLSRHDESLRAPSKTNFHRSWIRMKLLCVCGFLLATAVTTFSTLPSPIRRSHANAFRHIDRRATVVKLYATTASVHGSDCIHDKDIPMDFVETYLQNQEYTIEPFHGGGFNNRLYQIKNSTHTLVLKVFSDLAEERMALMAYPEVDEQLGKVGLGPKILASYPPKAILMEYIPRPPLTKSDLLIPSSSDTTNNSSSEDKTVLLLQKVGIALHELHNLAPPPRPSSSASFYSVSGNNRDPRKMNMLWRSIDLLLNRIRDKKTHAFFAKEIQYHHNILEKEFQLPMVNWGHGDCKPSNIILKGENDGVCFLDLELTGYNYRAYDLSKLLFRQEQPEELDSQSTNKLESQLQRSSQDCLLQSYLSASSIGDNPEDSSLVDDDSMERLRLECYLLLPMTWLEAALFFEATKDKVIATSCGDTKKQQQWDELARDRLDNYKKACQSPLFLDSIDVYRRKR